MKRKDFLKTGLTAGAGLTLPIFTSQKPIPVIRKARNIIFFSYDGFTWEDFSSAQHFSHRNFGKSLHLEKLFHRGAAGSMQSHSLTSMVTDSAAATTTWATGRKIVNGSLSIYPDGEELTTILELAKAEGKATGIVSNTTITHATPAGWIAKHLNRRDEENIAEQYAAFKADVMIGGGVEAFDPNLRSDRKDLFKPFKDSGYSVVTDLEDFRTVQPDKLLAALSEDHVPYEIDRRFRAVPAPTHREMAEKGLAILDGAENGFVLHIESGRIDHANHRTDAGASLWEVIAADETLGMLMEYVDKTPETVLIMASDHGTGGASVYGVGERYRSSSEIHDLLNKRTASFPWIMRELGRNPSEAFIKEILTETTGVHVSESNVRILQQAIAGDNRMPDEAAFPRQPIATLGYVLKGGTNDLPTHLNINYGTTQHTAGAVPAAIYGNGVDAKPFGLIDNTDFFYWMTEAMDIDYQNPEMSPEKAASFYE
ncbi:MAG: alkaline phosphatase [Balneolaceae bacterium]|nr:MAG: alkaline phosphatase [Balneolaceae bacterium]